HRDRADQRVAAAADEHVALGTQRAAHPVPAAAPAAADPGGPARAPAATVAGALPGREALPRGDVGAQRERRLETARARVALERVQAVDRDAAAGHVEVGALRAEDGGAVGGVDDDAGELGADRGGDRPEAVG